MFTFRFLAVLLFLPVITFSQKLKKADKAILTNLQSHVTYLADDKLEGRRAGSQGEKLASDYIIQQFKKNGLQPRGDNNGWLQPFEIYEGKQVNPATFLFINGNDLKLNSDYFPLSFSANAATEAVVARDLSESGVPWFFDVKELLEENKTPHYDLSQVRCKGIRAKGIPIVVKKNLGIMLSRTIKSL